MSRPAIPPSVSVPHKACHRRWCRVQGAGCRVQGVGAQSNDDQEVQWNLSIEDTIGTQLAVLYREVSLI